MGSCNFFIFVDIACNGLLFMLRKVLNVDTKLVTLQIYVSDTSDINGTWSAVPDLTKQIPKLFCICKKVELTQKNTLKKRFKTQLCNKYEFCLILLLKSSL